MGAHSNISFSFSLYLLYKICLPPLYLHSFALKQSIINPPLHFNLSPSIFYNTNTLWIFLSHSWHYKACQNGFAQHLEHLLFYGADTSSENTSGNTALHISALYNKASMKIDLLYWTIVTVIITVFFSKGVNQSLSFSEWSGELCPRSSVQGSK